MSSPAAVMQPVAHDAHGVGAEPPSPVSAHVEAYLAEYYGDLSDENLVIGRFLAGAAPPAGRQPARSLDVGCGPTLLYWALFFDDYDEYHGLEPDEDSVASLRSEIAGGVRGRMHDRYRTICELVDGPVRAAQERRFRSLCRRVRSVERGDAATRWPYADGAMDRVNMVFSLEVLPGREAVGHALGEARRVLAPEGAIVVATLGETTTWRVGDYVGSCLHITEASLGQDLAAAGFDRVAVRKQPATTAVERDQGYAWMLFATARRA